jgi:hypothetical protein
MKHLTSTLWKLSALVVLCGCGGGGYQPPPPGQPPLSANISGNWQFSTTSKAGMTPLTIAGSINLSGSAASGAAHVDGSTCFAQPTTMGLTGTLTGSKISLTSASVAGQVTTFTGSITDTVFTGTYTIDGGCAGGDHGNVTGIKMPLINGQLTGTFTTSGNQSFNVVAQLSQGSASSEGSFGITGTVTFNASCLSAGTITSGTFPSASFILGTSVALDIKTANGTVAFRGTADPTTGNISGDYTVSGSACDQTGTAVLVLTASSPWDY